QEFDDLNSDDPFADVVVDENEFRSSRGGFDEGTTQFKRQLAQGSFDPLAGNGEFGQEEFDDLNSDDPFADIVIDEDQFRPSTERFDEGQTDFTGEIRAKFNDEPKANLSKRADGFGDLNSADPFANIVVDEKEFPHSTNGWDEGTTNFN
ncbi:uncharacterized protein VTP21DRAFT_3944, partial [Calcarisporiella thermophila]|uniref:uncharacterized protein n=1 Tax=Calcarisporiella thermophila TaxID=911321 RepID=UPI003744ADC0